MLGKIKNLFIKLFKKPKLLEENKLQTKNETIKNSIFKEQLSKDTEIYNLQKLYEEGKITEDDLQISQIKKMIELYKEQIKALENN